MANIVLLDGLFVHEMNFFQTYSGAQLTMQILFLCKAQKKKKKMESEYISCTI